MNDADALDRAGLIKLLAAIPYFRGQGSAVIAALAACAVPRTFEMDANIFWEDQPATGLFLVEEGTVKISRVSKEGREHIMHLIAAGDTFNDVAALDGGMNPATATACTAVKVWEISRRDLQRLAEQYPQLAWALVESIARRARHLVGLVQGLALRNVRGRLAHLLLAEARSLDSGTVPRMLTQEDMAARLGTVREVVGRALRSLANDGIIEFDRHRIVILDPERLTAAAEV